MRKLKNLHHGECLDDLKKHMNLPDIKKYKLTSLLKSANNLYREAEKAYLEGDEEESYIKFMRYFRLIEVLQKSPEGITKKKYLSEMLGSNKKITEAMDKTEKLQESLIERYKKLAEEKKNHNENTLKEISIEDNHIDMNSSNSLIFQKNGLRTSVTCEELFKMIQDPNSSILIMDCRSKKDYEESKLIFRYCLNVPEEIILMGMSAGKLQYELEPEGKAMWASRSLKDHIIILDWNTKAPEPQLHSPAWRLKSILENWDPDVTYKSPIKILEGGYEHFLTMYPMICSNPNIIKQKTSDIYNPLLDEIEYPSINDITMKSNTSDKNPPQINRESKGKALKMYEEKQQMFEIVSEREKLTQKLVENSKIRIKIENNLKDLESKLEKMENDDRKEQIEEKRKEMEYNLMQIESKNSDYKIENERLQANLEQFRARKDEFNEIVSEKEAVNLEKATKRIEVKLLENKQLEEEQQIVTREREKQVAFAKEHKRHSKPPSEDEICKPKIPQFDRSNKPDLHNDTLCILNDSYRREFNPILGNTPCGLTGLKNLGNTCYMNSVVQCLSNTSPLVEYFETNNYKNHINRNSKTKGLIVEEIAAVIKALWSGKYKCIAIIDLRFYVGQYQPIFNGIDQQDSHEFLTILIDWLHSDLQTLRISEILRDNLSASKKSWLEYTKSRESFILQLFYGQIKSTVKCYVCNKESATYECFSNLSLELPPTSNRCDLIHCFEMYFNGELIKGWNCPNCKEKRKAIKKLAISKLPSILVIHLKRFYLDTDYMCNYRKKQNYVNFPLSSLNVSSYVAPSEIKNNTPKIYNLYAVSNHYGSMECGHYTAFCKNSSLRSWFKFDDQVVTALDPTDVVSSAGYILFYTCLPDTPA